MEVLTQVKSWYHSGAITDEEGKKSPEFFHVFIDIMTSLPVLLRMKHFVGKEACQDISLGPVPE